MASSAPPLAPSAGLDRAALFGVLAAGLGSALLLLWAIDAFVVSAVFLAVIWSAAALVLLFARARRAAPAEAEGADWSLTNAAIEDAAQPVAVTDRAGRLVCANRLYGEWFSHWPAPPALPLSDDGADRLAAAGRTAWRDGEGVATDLSGGRGRFSARVARAGHADDHLVWRFAPALAVDLLAEARAMIAGEGGNRLAAAGVMAALVDGGGRLLAANRALLARALGTAEAAPAGRPFVDLLATGTDEYIRLAAESETADPLRLVQIPLDQGDPGHATIILLLDEDGAVATRPGARSTATANVHALLAMLPLGLALAERDGRILFMNEAFERAAAIPAGQSVLYPGDLVVKEDKAAVSDAVRRFSAGHRVSGDLSVRLRWRPEEPVALTIAGARGLGEAAVLLSLKDNSEESKLKKQVLQATKMQAVGQLAGGVAHDFNNILTAIIGHCDLMMMRHAPGDSDYDDIQQIRQNSNRAASLTRQLLAFSRQQTLRPQMLQLPDVVSEVSNLLRRLLGETVTLTVKHGRDLGAVRADPGQLEQVIVNLAVNARDAMPGGGTLTIQTYAVPAAQVRDLDSEILPVADYTALSVSDTGSGIAPEILAKIFEPFFTTKEVGKGTGLGLSTVYGIVKQSEGFIFAESTVGEGTSFVIYLPVHRAPALAEPAAPPPREKPAELWGTGTILIVEDEDMVRAVAERALTRQGYTVHTASNGEEALEMLADMAAAGGPPVDLLISDVVMPTMDGPTMVRQARARYPHLPILFMSGYAEEQLRRSIDLDHVAFIAKPFSVQQLAAAARDALRAKASSPEP
ncbi:hybrid sensor histidine kinase/response regulator [Sphingomonas profundi]|uniref:hybrid sensor histidine kinase/response regulator n=1 Tax=Alterirhizorhabdus profundi TaxID=2681549 RepID=UPI0012E78E5E|nr:response regulator [Sphingomonas profundi]